MADQDTRHVSWWTTVPGILTALAAVITATGGLVAVLTQNGFFKTDERESTGASVGAVSPVSAEKNQRSGTSAPSTSQRAQTSSRSPAEVVKNLRAQGFEGIVVTSRDGTAISLYAASGRFYLTNGQEVEFDRVSTVEVREPNIGYGRVLFTLLNGQQFESDLEVTSSNFVGRNELGNFSTRMAQIERIEFLRPRK